MTKIFFKVLILLSVYIILYNVVLVAGDESIKIYSAGDYLEINEYLGNVTDHLDNSDAEALRTSTISDKYTDRTLLQVLRLNWGAGTSKDDMSVSKVIYTNNNANITGDYLWFENAEEIFNYDIDFPVGFGTDINASTRQLDHLIGKNFTILGENFTVSDATFSITGNLTIQLDGQVNSIIFEDLTTDSVSYDGKAWVNDNYINSANVSIEASNSSNYLNITSITYIYYANSSDGNNIFVSPGGFVKGYLAQEEGLLTSNWNITYEGLSNPSTSQITITSSGDDEYRLAFTSTQNILYNNIRMAYSNDTGLYYGDDDDFLVYSQGTGTGAENFTLKKNDYVVLSVNGTEDTGITRIFRLDGIDKNTSKIILADMGNGTSVNATYTGNISSNWTDCQGNISIGTTDFLFYCINTSDTGKGQIQLLVDLDGDGTVGGEAHIVVLGGGMIDLGAQDPDVWRQAIAGSWFGINITTDKNNFDEAPSEDEWFIVNISKNLPGVDLNVTSKSSIGLYMNPLNGSLTQEQGMTNYGVLARRVIETADPDEIYIEYPIEQLLPQVFLVFETVTADSGLVTPTDGMNITQDTVFTPGTYNLRNGVNIAANDITLDCNGASLVGNGALYGVTVTSKNNVTIENCSISNYTSALFLQSSENISMVENSFVNNTGSGLFLLSSSNNNISNNNMTGNQRGITLHSGSDNNTIENNWMFNNSNYGLYFTLSSNNNDIKHNWLENNSYNAYNDQISNINLEENYWGTRTTSEIQNSIYDYSDDNSKGVVDYCPFLDNPYPEGDLTIGCEWEWIESQVTLVSPANGTVLLTNNVTDFTFYVLDDVSQTDACYLYYGDTKAGTNNSVSNNTNTTFFNVDFPEGSIQWRIFCTDNSYTNGWSETRTIIVPQEHTTTTINTVANTTYNINATSNSDINMSTLQNITGTVNVTQYNTNPAGTAASSSNGFATLGVDIFLILNTTPNIIGNLSWYLLTINYSDSDLPSNIDESTLRIYYFNETSNQWQVEANSGVNTATNQVWANISHFSIFSLGGSQQAGGTTPSGGGGGGGGSIASSESIVVVPSSEASIIEAPKNQQIDIVYETNVYSFKVKSITGSVVTLTKLPEVDNMLLANGLTKYIDLDSDGRDDITIQYIGQSASKAMLLVYSTMKQEPIKLLPPASRKASTTIPEEAIPVEDSSSETSIAEPNNNPKPIVLNDKQDSSNNHNLTYLIVALLVISIVTAIVVLKKRKYKP